MVILVCTAKIKATIVFLVAVSHLIWDSVALPENLNLARKCADTSKL